MSLGGFMGILLWVVFGVVAGSVAKLVMPGPDRLGIIGTMLLGITGAVLGGFIGTSFGYGTAVGFDLRGLLMAIFGAIGVLFCFRAFSMRSAEHL
jgi:uncharacterized membrane protein YeaQ/YmgE (transglycosylase-associated protein family)